MNAFQIGSNAVSHQNKPKHGYDYCTLHLRITGWPFVDLVFGCSSLGTAHVFAPIIEIIYRPNAWRSHWSFGYVDCVPSLVNSNGLYERVNLPGSYVGLVKPIDWEWLLDNQRLALMSKFARPQAATTLQVMTGIFCQVAVVLWLSGRGWDWHV